MADTEKTPAMLLDEIASLDPQARREVAHHTRTKSWVRDAGTCYSKRLGRNGYAVLFR